jgi:hypothetical protein
MLFVQRFGFRLKAFDNHPDLSLHHLRHVRHAWGEAGRSAVQNDETVNHASEEIRRVNQRLVVADMREELNAIKFPAAAGPDPRPLDDTHTHPASEKRGEHKSTPKPPPGPNGGAASPHSDTWLF